LDFSVQSHGNAIQKQPKLDHHINEYSIDRRSGFGVALAVCAARTDRGSAAGAAWGSGGRVEVVR